MKVKVCRLPSLQGFGETGQGGCAQTDESRSLAYLGQNCHPAPFTRWLGNRISCLQGQVCVGICVGFAVLQMQGCLTDLI